MNVEARSHLAELALSSSRIDGLLCDCPPAVSLPSSNNLAARISFPTTPNSVPKCNNYFTFTPDFFDFFIPDY
jgi:hypothetical protein